MPTHPFAAIAAVAAGSALVALAGTRLSGLAFPRMPRATALVAAVAGAASVASGAAILARPPAASPARLDLAPQRVGTDGSISGVVQLASGQGLAGAKVVLRTFERTEERSSTQGSADASGRFAFDGLSTGPTTVYTVSSDYGGTTFRSGLVFPGGPQMQIVVAETTDDPSAVGFDVDSTVLAGDERGLDVLHIVRVANHTLRAYSGGLRLPLLPGASELDPREGLDRTRLVVDDGELVSLSPVLPGSTEIVYRYAAPFPRTGLRVRRTVTHETRTWTLLAAQNLSVLAPGLRSEGTVRIGDEDGRSYTRFARAGLEDGDRIDATVSVRSTPAWVRPAVVASAGTLAAAVLLYPLVRRRRARA